MPGKNFGDMTAKELEDMARDAGISGYSSMKKDELVKALQKQSAKSSRSSSAGSSSAPGVLTLLKQEHDEVKAMFSKFETQAARDLQGTRTLADTIINELTRHAEMEEQIVYPGLEEEDTDVYHEAHEEHHVAELLMAELSGMKPDDTYKAKMLVLAENVRHHIEEEESEGFDTLRELGAGRLEEMAEQWKQAKQSWKPGRKLAASRA